uniref:Endonuclease III homolog n=2 Tax=Chromera velia CCMP2878 TaxID=1169474 RepID=A0A0K6S7R4_9ALVE|eukprot:Cvel_21941.t2-p1 / transcript=Cvel_21941.t2 / gene=Cvel_21941 / organism=Chromera_velia_CCMP2878 / gene_product=hypothetical protein / transcript_product=hypothetical protein / location=Cvel_scaffold2106:6301-9728(-) / protein_length=484 / sequence_SO=supercontig / SO=protein_coding / is_pseudo=false
MSSAWGFQYTLRSTTRCLANGSKDQFAISLQASSFSAESSQPLPPLQEKGTGEQNERVKGRKGKRGGGLSARVNVAVETEPKKKEKEKPDGKKEKETAVQQPPARQSKKSSGAKNRGNRKNEMKETADVGTKQRKRKRGAEAAAASSSSAGPSSPSSTPSLPDDFQDVWDAVTEMRTHRDAPVDLMGTEAVADPQADPLTWRFQTLVAAMLSSQTKDEVVAACMGRLRARGLSLQTILSMPEDELRTLLYGVGFHNNKTKFIKTTAKILQDQHGGDVPKTFDEMVALPGIGPKMTHIILSACWGVVEGIAVDIHVHRIANRLRWVKTKTPEETEKKLKEWLPRDKWRDVNILLVGFGQQICTPVKPQCGVCLCRPFCPEGRRWRPPPGQEGEEEEGDMEDIVESSQPSDRKRGGGPEGGTKGLPRKKDKTSSTPLKKPNWETSRVRKVSRASADSLLSLSAETVTTTAAAATAAADGEAGSSVH